MLGKELFACKTAVNDFNAILETIGGKNERRRARYYSAKHLCNHS